jgi:negative regulator of sigma E activity
VGTSRSGVATAYTTIVDGHQVTAVGEVPTRTLKYIATGLRPAPAAQDAQDGARAAANRRD